MKKTISTTLCSSDVEFGEGVWANYDFGNYETTGLDRLPYNGTLKNVKFHGRGLFVSPCGKRIEGEWESGERNGIRIYICVCANGNVYELDDNSKICEIKSQKKKIKNQERSWKSSRRGIIIRIK